MKFSNIFFLLLTLLFIGCNDDEETTPAVTTPVIITVIDATQWSPENTNPQCSGAKIVLTSNSGEYTQTTNASGEATFDNLVWDTYKMLVSKDGKYNLADYDVSTGTGYAVLGMFHSQEEVADYSCPGEPESPIQPNAQAGDLKLVDASLDCLISEDDLVSGVTFNNDSRKDVNGDGIVNSNDMVDGAYQYYDELRVTVYIGD